MLRVIGCITQEHDFRLVVLAAIICVLACFTTLELLAHVQQRSREQPSSGRQSWGLLPAGATVFGFGVWSLHFVAMLAFMPGMPINYDIQATILSALIAVGGTLAAFMTWQLLPSRQAGIILGGLLLGCSVTGMHYCGVAAMQVPGVYRLDHHQVGMSAVISIAFAILALARSHDLALLRRRIEVSTWLGLCVCSVHFIGMSALSIDLSRPTHHEGAVLGSGALAIAVGSVSLAILAVSLAATLMEQHLSQRAVIELKRMQLLSDISQEVLVIHRNSVILQINEAGSRMFGLPVQQLIGRPVMDLITEDDRAAFMRDTHKEREGLKPGESKSREIRRGVSKPREIRMQTTTGMLIPVELSSSMIEYEGKTAIAMALRDMSDHKRDEAKIRHLAHHDALTDLPNRFLLRERLTYALDAAARSKGKVALLYLDLDRFKPVNDALGHAGGDLLLIQVARRLAAELSSTDTLARVGGDEFVIVTSIDQAGMAASLAERLVESIARPFDLGGHQIEIGTSIGIALYPEDCGSQETLMLAADTALYRAKDEKRGTFRFFEPTMNENLQLRRQLEQDLRQAVDRNEFELYYQPLVSCTTGKVEGYEALLRWNHPRRGLIMPMEFIPLAEETGLIVKISQWVLDAACRAAAAWDQPYRVAINISPVQFRQSDLPLIVAATLARTGLAADRLEIEITEGVLMEDTARAIEILSALRRQGVSIALDDFGTGYSSLSYLRSFTFDKLKIDKSFIHGLGHSEEATMIVRTIIGLAHNLGLSIVAEGVETSVQLAMIRDHMCDQVQGYLLGRPMPMDSSTELTAARAKLPLIENRVGAAVK